MLSDFRFSRGGVLCQVLGFSALVALLFVAGCGSSANTVTIGPPAKLAFATQPSSASAGGMITPAVTVSIEDAQGNVVTTATNQVTIAIGTNPSSGTLSGTATAAAVAGVATFSNLSINNAGTGYTLAASATGLTGATSGAFNEVGPPAKLAFTVQPGNVAAGSSITPAVAVSVEDAAGNVVATATNQITIAIGTNPSSGTLSGAAQASAVAGVATFSNLSINSAGTGYTLSGSATGLTGATSSAFNVTVGAAAKLAFTAQPSNTTGGVAVAPAVQVTIEDSQGNTVTTATNQITIAIGTNPSSGTLSGTAQANAVAGVATFSNLSINSAGTGYTLTANATGLTAATSSAFNILVGPAAKLAFTVQPTNTGGGATITPAVAVSVEDAAGNVVPAATNQITVAIGTNPSTGTLSGTAQVNAAAGVATFSTLSINNTGIGYTLTASATGLTGATSSAFNIFGAAAKLAFTVQPSNVSPASSITPAVQVTIEDSQGSTVTTATNQVTIAIGTNPSTGTLSGTATAAAVAGVATFSDLSINNAGTGYTLTATATGLTGATSSAFNVAVTSCGTSCSISGTVTGPLVSGVTVTLSGGPSTPTPATTNSSGMYSFTGLTQGTYTITPSLAGYTFSPSAPSVSIGAATVQNFTETSAFSSYSITGTLTYSGTKTGSFRTFIRVYSTTNTCTGNCGGATAGTSLASEPSSTGTSYTVRGLQQGTYYVAAEIDTLNNGAPNASNPYVKSATFTIDSSSPSNVSVPTIALQDPSVAPTPVAPILNSGDVAAGSTFALVQYDQHNGGALADSNGRELATSYKVYWDTNPNFTSGTFATFAAHGTHDNNYIVSNLAAGTYHFQVSAIVGNVEVKSASVSATLPPAAGAFTFSGTVTFPGTATGPLYVGLFDGQNSVIYGKQILTPSSGVAFSITGVPAGNYQAFAIIDQNNNGLIEPSDISNVSNNNGGPPPLAITTSNITGYTIALTSAVSTVNVSTNHQQNLNNTPTDTYGMNLGISWGTKRPVAMTLLSGPNVTVPWDVPVDSNNGEGVNLNGATPVTGDTYQFQVTFSDGSTQTMPVSITVLNSFVTGMAMNSPVAGTQTMPVLNWVAPASPPSPYTYYVGLYSVSGSNNVQWQDNGGHNGNGIASGTTSIPFNQDGSATSNGSSITALPTTTNYQWFVGVQDANGNSSQEVSTYNIP